MALLLESQEHVLHRVLGPNASKVPCLFITWTLHLDPIVKDLNMYVVGDRVVPVYHSIRNDLPYGLWRVLHTSQPPP